MSDPVYVLFALCAIAALADRLGRLPIGRSLGSAIIVLLLGIVLANVGVIPTGSAAPALYPMLVMVGAPVSIFLLLLDVRLAALKRAGLPMLLAFGLGALGTMVGVAMAYGLTNANAWLGGFAAPIAGMYAATFIGGSANFNALALHYGVVEEPALYAAANVVDGVVGAMWLGMLVVMVRAMRSLSGRRPDAIDGQTQEPQEDLRPVDVSSIATLVALAFGAHWLSMRASDWLTSLGMSVPAILILTTFALVMAQIPLVRRVGGARILGIYGAYLFIAVIGAYCDIEALLNLGQIGWTLVLFVAVSVAVHGVIVFGGGRLLGLPPEMMAIASSANIGGATTVMPVASGVSRMDLLLPGILVGTLGNAVGTYAGFAVAWILGR